MVAVSRTQADLDSLVREVGVALSQPSGRRARLRAGRDSRPRGARVRQGLLHTLPHAGRTASVGGRRVGRTTPPPGLRSRQKWLPCRPGARRVRALGGNRLAGGGARLPFPKPRVAQWPRGRVNYPPPAAAWDSEPQEGDWLLWNPNPSPCRTERPCKPSPSPSHARGPDVPFLGHGSSGRCAPLPPNTHSAQG